MLTLMMIFLVFDRKNKIHRVTVYPFIGKEYARGSKFSLFFDRQETKSGYSLRILYPLYFRKAFINVPRFPEKKVKVLKHDNDISF